MVIPYRAADARSSDRACVWCSCGWERGPSSRTKTGTALHSPGSTILACGLRSASAPQHWHTAHALAVSVSNPAPRRILSRATILATCNGWMRCQGREDGARVGGSGRSFASGCASNRRRRRPQRQEQRRVGPLPTATSARHPEPASRVLGRDTALIWAASEGHTRVVEQLIAAGAEVDVQSTHSDSRRTRSPCLQAHSEAGV